MQYNTLTLCCAFAFAISPPLLRPVELAAAEPQAVVDIGSRRALFVDELEKQRRNFTVGRKACSFAGAAARRGPLFVPLFETWKCRKVT
jgi:hypothetical protein